MKNVLRDKKLIWEIKAENFETGNDVEIVVEQEDEGEGLIGVFSRICWKQHKAEWKFMNFHMATSVNWQKRLPNDDEWNR